MRVHSRKFFGVNSYIPGYPFDSFISGIEYHLSMIVLHFYSKNNVTKMKLFESAICNNTLP